MTNVFELRREPSAPALDLFFIEGDTEARKEDEGWYFWPMENGDHVGDPHGPYPTEQKATWAALGDHHHLAS